MRHQKHKGNLGVSIAHRKSMLANLVTSLVTHNRITTTLARAKETSKLADKMITLAKRNTLHARRQIISQIRSKEAARKLIDELAPLFKDRRGGYTRVLKYKRRLGDNAMLALVEFTEYPEVKESKKVKKKKTEDVTKGKESEKTEEYAPQKASKKATFFSSLRKFVKK